MIFELASNPLVLASALLAIVVGSLAPLLQRTIALWNIPHVRLDAAGLDEHISRYPDPNATVLDKGYQLFKDTIFGVKAAAGLKLVLPLRLVEEVASNPAFSFHESLSADTLVDYTHIGGLDREPLDGFKRSVTPQLGKFLPSFVELTKLSLADSPGNVEGWKAVKVYPIMLNTAASLFAQVTIGSYGSTNPAWIAITTGYVGSAISFLQALKRWPAFMHPIVYRWLPDYQEVEYLLSRIRSMIKDAISVYDEQEARKTVESPPPLLYNLSRKPESRTGPNLEKQIQWQLILAVAGIHTTAATLTQCLFDLGARPDLAAPLRAEIKAVYDEHKGEFTKAALAKLKKLDSFIREVHRLHAPDLTTIQRKAKTAVTLSDGTHIPKGVKLEVPTFAVHRDEQYYESPDEFDPWRFLRLSEKTGKPSSYVTMSKEFLGWGLGKAGCPGRFLADMEIKVVLCHLLLKYEITNPEGVPRHADLFFGSQVDPDHEGEIMLRSIGESDIEEDGTIRREA